MQFNFDNNTLYLNEIKFLKLQNNDNNNSYEGGHNESSKPKENIPSDESNVSKSDSTQEINIGYPVDANEFKKLKDKAKIKKNEIEDNTIEYNNISQEDKN